MLIAQWILEISDIQKIIIELPALLHNKDTVYLDI